MEHFISLWLFTFASQAAVGMVLVKAVLLIAGRIGGDDIRTEKLQKAITLLLLFSLATAFFHLGKPFRAVYALNNIGTSPLSMEIASLSLLLVTAAAGVWLCLRGTVNLLTRLLPAVEVAAGLLLLLTMTAVYMLPSVPAWYTAMTPLAFVLTVVSAGPAAFAMVARNDIPGGSRWLLAAGAVAAMLLAASGVAGVAGRGTLVLMLFILQAALALAAFVLISRRFNAPDLNKNSRMTVITAILVLMSGFIARLLFFLSYDNTIL